MRSLRRFFAASLAVAVLSSCGGGGDDGPAPLNITASSPTAGTTGATYAGYIFAASGGTPPLSWKESGPLPPGLTLSAAGQLSGTPATAGNYPITVTATDSSIPPLTASAQVNLQVNDSVIVIAPASPPAGTVTYAYPGFGFTASGGSPPYSWKANGTPPPGLTMGSDGTVSGIPTQAGSFAFSVVATDSAQQPMSSAPLATQITIGNPGPSFTYTTSMKIPRSGHVATLLLSGKVLVTGGGYGTADPSAELYDPATGTFSTTTGNMAEARSGHTATLLGNPALANYGKVLILGSTDNTAELFDPGSGTFAATGHMNQARTSPTATLLNTGKVLVVGGNPSTADLRAELYDPVSGTFSYTPGGTTILRNGHTATLLDSGQVLIAGGNGTATAELYDPDHGTFSATTGNMTEARAGHTATRLGTAANAVQSGYVLIIGPDLSAELYEPSTQTFTRVGSLPPLTITGFSNGGSPAGFSGSRNTASLRSDGTVLAAGGSAEAHCYLFGVVSRDGAALFAPQSDGFTVTGSLNTARNSHTATVLQDGTILVVGGTQNYFATEGVRCISHLSKVLSSAEVFK